MYKQVFALSMLAGGIAHAEAPKVVTDIAPVHSLVATVMQGVGTPDIILPPGASPHGYAMRPSEARALQSADSVIWIGEELTPWLEHSIESLASNAATLELLHSEGTQVLEIREDAVFGAHDEHDDEHHDEHDEHHDHEEGDHDEAHHDDHDDHDEHHDDHAEHHDDHADHDEAHSDHDEHDDHAGHSHEGDDPHAWLDPANAQIWLTTIAQHLSELDPANAETYAQNAAAGAQAIETLTADLQAQIAPVGDKPFVVFHDAYQYFETRMGLSSLGALQVSDASKPSAARLSELRDEMNEHGVQCIFQEPQFDASLVYAVTNGEITTGVWDPLGAALETGPAMYGNLLRLLTDNAQACLTN